MAIVQIKTELHFDELLKAVSQLNLNDLNMLMSEVISLQARRKSQSFSKIETDLMLKINKGLSTETQKRFDELIEKRQSETLTLSEHEELINLNEQIEKLNAERLKNMSELARTRGISLKKLMQDSEIFTITNA